MLKNYLIAAWRRLVRRKWYSAINVLGLSLGVAFCLLAWQLVAFEYSFDSFHEKEDRVYLLNRTVTWRGETRPPLAGPSARLGPGELSCDPQLARTIASATGSGRL